MVALKLLLQLVAMVLLAGMAGAQTSALESALDVHENVLLALRNATLEAYRNRQASTASCQANSPLAFSSNSSFFLPLACDVANINSNSVVCTDVSGSSCTSTSNPQCSTKEMVNTQRSYARIPAGQLQDQTSAVQGALCWLGAGLDSALRSEFNNGNIAFLLYFGSATGAFISFPGRQNNLCACGTTDPACLNYDPRQRYWYPGASSIAKDLVVVLDMDGQMGSDFSQTLRNVTKLDVAKSVIENLLPTLYQGRDRMAVVISTADGDGAQTLPDSNSDLITATDYPTSSFASLQQAVASLSVTDQKANITAAILEALDIVQSSRSEAVQKIVLVLAGAETQDDALAAVNSTSLALSIQQAQNAVNAIGGEESLVTAIYAIGSREDPEYFNYLGNAMASATGAQWSYGVAFTAVGSEDNATLAASMPVYDDQTDTLVGVVALDLLLADLGRTPGDPEVDDAIKTRNTARATQAAANLAAPCLGERVMDLTDACAASQCDPASRQPKSYPILTDAARGAREPAPQNGLSFQDLVCCPECAAKGTQAAGDGGLSTGALIGIIAGGAVFCLILLAVIAGLLYRRQRAVIKARKQIAPPKLMGENIADL
eukprot:jgi/Chlat1/7163/Chrsp57S06818